MPVHDVLLAVHVAAGSAGLLAGLVALLAPKRRGRHPSAGRVYQVAVAALTVTAVGLAALDWGRLWWLALIAVATEAAALGGLWARRRRFPGWIAWHVRLMGASYISLVTALLVVNWPYLIVWVLPTVVGTPLNLVAARRAAARGRGAAPSRPASTGSGEHAGHGGVAELPWPQGSNASTG